MSFDFNIEDINLNDLCVVFCFFFSDIVFIFCIFLKKNFGRFVRFFYWLFFDIIYF